MTRRTAADAAPPDAPADGAPAALPPEDLTLLQTVLLARAPGLVWAADAALCCRYAAGVAAERCGIVAGSPIAASCLAANGAGLAAHQRALAGDTVRYDVRCGETLLSCLVEPWRGGDGETLGVLGSAEDATERLRAADALATQQSVFATMLDQSVAGIAILDAQGRLLFNNAAIRRFALGEGTQQPLVDATEVWGEWRAGDGRALAVDEWPLARALRGEVVDACEMHREKPDGRREYVSVGAAPVRDAGGTLVGVVVTGADITARRQIELQTQAMNEVLEQRVRDRTAALERSQQTLTDIVDHSTAVIYLKDRDRRYLLVNREFERLFNVTNATVAGHTDADLFPPDIVAALRTNDERVLEVGDPLHIEEVVPSDGIDRTYLSVKFPLRDRDGAIYGVCGISTDITERKRIDAALQRSEATLTAVVDSAPDPIWAVDRQFRLVAYNASAAHFIASLVGIDARPDLPLPALQSNDLIARWLPRIQRALAGERFTVEERLDIDGSEQRFLVSLNPTMQDGRATGVAVFSKNITELIRTAELARQHQAELAHVLRLHTMGEMAASLAHEVNQPLGAIANYAQGVRRRLDAGGIQPAELRHSVEAIAQEALRAGEITRRVRQILRKEDAPRAPIDLNDIVAKALRVAEPTARPRHVTLSAHPAAALPAVMGDAIQIEQVLFNLILNGIEAIPATHAVRQVTVHTRATDEGVEVVVGDSGVGIDASRSDIIFEAFLTTKPGGLGMGLAISRSIVEAHGGRLWAVCRGEGGAEMHVVLPAAPLTTVSSR